MALFGEKDYVKDKSYQALLQYFQEEGNKLNMPKMFLEDSERFNKFR